jgi:6-phosphogluconolactonase
MDFTARALKHTLACALTLALATPPIRSAAAQSPERNSTHSTDYFLYIGSFTGPAPNGHPDGGTPSKGIYVATFNSATGDLGVAQLAAEIPDPSFLAISPDQRFLYAAIETQPESFASAYAIDASTGKLHLLNKLSSGGAGTAFISLDRTGKFALLAHYGSSSVSVISIKPDGSLGEMTAFIQHSASHSVSRDPSEAPVIPRPHSIVVSPDNRFAIVPDLGLNKLFIYGFDPTTGSLSRFPPSAIDLAPDEGPRHFVFSPDGKFGYLIAQTTGNVIVFSWDQLHGTLTQLQAAPSFPKGLDASNMSAEIAITPDGKFLYESNRRTHGPNHELGPDSIGVYSVNPHTGLLTEVQQAAQDAALPRCITIDPTGRYLLMGAQQNNRIEVFRIDPHDGKLSNTGKSTFVHTPACMQFASGPR